MSLLHAVESVRSPQIHLFWSNLHYALDTTPSSFTPTVSHPLVVPVVPVVPVPVPMPVLAVRVKQADGQLLNSLSRASLVRQACYHLNPPLSEPNHSSKTRNTLCPNLDHASD